jgi:hypothetical protein
MAEQNRLARELDSRKVAARPEAWRPPETLPTPDERPGWKHRWVRVSMMGQPDGQNVSAKFREGYEACKIDEYPEMMHLASQDSRFKGNIEIGGCCCAASQRNSSSSVLRIMSRRTKPKWIRSITIFFVRMTLACPCLRTRNRRSLLVLVLNF